MSDETRHNVASWVRGGAYGAIVSVVGAIASVVGANFAASVAILASLFVVDVIVTAIEDGPTKAVDQ